MANFKNLFKNDEFREKNMANNKEVFMPPVLFKETQEVVKEIEDRLQAPFISYFNSNAGSVCDNDANAIYELVKDIKVKKIYLYIKSDGGNGISALKIISALRGSCEELIALIPSNCASAATMLALGANQIQMGTLAFLTAIDSSLRHELSPVDKTNSLVSVSMDELNRVIKLWQKDSGNSDANPYAALYNHIHPLVIGAVDRASSLSMKVCSEILKYHIKDEDKIFSIASKLNSNYPAHNYPILLREAQEIGLNAVELDNDLGNMLQNLGMLYSEMGQRAYTDYDENNYHDNNIANIIEKKSIQIYYQIDKDWFYRSDERRWNVLNDMSSWRRNEFDGKKIKNSIYHLW